MNLCDSEVSPHGQALAARHRNLDAQIEGLSGNPAEDSILLTAAKRKRLHLRDKVAVHAPQLLRA